MKRDSRLPPGQRQVTDFPVLHLGPVPPFDAGAWDFRIGGLVRKELRLTWPEFLALARVEVEADFHCVTGWSRLANHWEGALFRTLAGLAGLRSEVRFVTVVAEHGYTTSLPLADVMRQDVVLAWRHDSQELSPEHGFPLRLVVPHKYAYKSAKWVRALRFTADRELGFWEQRGYSDSADPWREERLG